MKAAETDAKLTIVLIVAAAFGWRDLASNSDGFLETPNLDRLRAEGMFFTNAYAGGAATISSRG
jgi:arylsulfatase A-like enzyme